MKREAPKINTQLRSHTIMVPECIRNASGIVINGKRIKSLLFSTDVAVISNCNADAVIAVYPFTPTMQITNSIIDVAQRTGDCFGCRITWCNCSCFKCTYKN